MEKRLIESTKFPIDIVNDKSGREKQRGGIPPFWEMVFWWTRKPLIGARAVIAASLLPENISKEDFIRNLRLTENTPHRHNPIIPKEWKIYFERKKLLDPFAGFGSIPFEGLRLGLDVTACELLPTAYIFLKAVLEYPLKYGEKLVEDIKKWGEWIIEELKKDEDLKELYDEDVAVYVGTWEVRCPHCRKWTPLVGNWWLARVKDSNGKYKRLAYMDYVRNKEGVEIKVVDLNKEVNSLANVKIDTGKGLIIAGGREYKVPSANIESRREQATCLNCGNVIKFVDAEGNHYTDKKEVIKEKREALEWYVKWALKKYHEGDESYAKQRLLVKVKVIDNNLIFEPCNEKDNEKLRKVAEIIKKLGNDTDIPDEQIPMYDPRNICIINYGFTKQKHLFNPRQLLTLVKLVKLIRKVGKKVEEEKIKEGWNKEESKNYAEGVVTYLGMAMIRYIDYNTIVTLWHSGGQLPAQVAHSLSMRGLTVQWNWGDVSPFVRISGTGNLVRNLDSLYTKIIPYLITVTGHCNLKDFTVYSVRVFIDDATILSKINDKFDIIITDPPYADDVPYTELSDLYYVWLKRALSDVENGKLVPRFHIEAFFKKIGDKYVEIKTQWQEFAKREVSTNPGRFKDEKDSKKKAEEHFQNLLTQSFIAMKERLKEDGLLVTYYAHTSPEAWASLLEAGWKGARATITNAIPLTTESAQRVTARGKLALDTSIAVVWRIGKQEKETNILSLKEEIIESAKNRARELIKNRYTGRDILVGTMAAALNIVTRYKELYDSKGDLDVRRLLTDYVYPFTAIGIVKALKEIAKAGEITSSEALFYLLVKALFGSKEKTIAKKMDRNDLSLLQISTKARVDKLKANNLIKDAKKEGENKEYELLEPLSKDATELEKFLRDERKINLGKLKVRNSLDVLHLMEYYTQILPLSKFLERWQEIKESYPVEAEEAFTLAKILLQILPDTDPEKELTFELVKRVEEKSEGKILLRQEEVFKWG